MKILIIRNCKHISGAETYNFSLLTGLKQNGRFDIYAITNCKAFAKKLADLVTKVIYLPYIGAEIGTKKELMIAIILFPVYIIAYLICIHQLEGQKRFNLIILQSTTEKILLTPFLKLLRYKIIWIEHGPFYNSNNSEIIKLGHLITSKLVDHIIAVSLNTKLDLLAQRINNNKVDLVHIGIDTSVFCDQEKNTFKHTYSIKQNTKIIGYIGTIVRQKGLKDFVLIAQRIIKKYEQVLFLIVGDGPDSIWLKEFVGEKHIANKFIFVGYVDDVRNYIEAFDLLLFPTLHNEGISMSILEAQSMAKTVVARNIGGNQEIIEHEVNGYIFSNWKKEQIQKKIVELLRYPKKLKLIGSRARLNIVKNFNASKQIPKFVKLFTNYE